MPAEGPEGAPQTTEKVLSPNRFSPKTNPAGILNLDFPADTTVLSTLLGTQPRVFCIVAENTLQQELKGLW